MKMSATQVDFHKAAREGCCKSFKYATKADVNRTDEDGMTPVHWAAYFGHLEVLRIVIGRRGNAEACDIWGSTPLHIAVSQNHMNCVTFLVNYGVNLWSQDNDGHTPLDIAALHERGNILSYLDAEMERQSTRNPRAVERLKQLSQKDAEKRLVLLDKLQSRFCSEQNLSPSLTARLLSWVSRKPKRRRSYFGNNNSPNESKQLSGDGDDIGRKSRLQIFSQYLRRNSKHVATASSFEARHKLSIATISQPHSRSSSSLDNTTGLDPAFHYSSVSYDLEPSSLFERPGFGSFSFRSVSMSNNNTLLNMSSCSSNYSCFEEQSHHFPRNASISRGALPWSRSEQISEDLESFLEVHGLSDYLDVFVRDKITVDSIQLLTEKDLENMGLPLGPRKIILKALKDSEGTSLSILTV